MPASIDDVLAMTVFARVAEAGSFTGAARTLGLSKSVVSARVAALEARLGVRLLYRTTRKVSLTPEGAQLHARCVRMREAADEAAAVLGGVGAEPEGTLRVSAPVGVGLTQLAPVLPLFSRAYPRVRLDVSLSDRAVDLVADGFDVALRIAPRLVAPGVVVRRVAIERTVLCASPDYLARRGEPERPLDLLSHDCLRHGASAGPWVVGGERLEVAGPLVSDNIAVLRDAALGGLGIAWLPRSMVDQDLREGRLRRVLPRTAERVLRLWAVIAHRRLVPAKVRVFVEFLAAHLGARSASR